MYNKILVPLDGSKLSECAIDHIDSIANVKSSELVLLNILELTQPFSSMVEFQGSREAAVRMEQEWQKVENQNYQKAQDYLNKEAEALKFKGIQAKIVVVKPEPGKGTAETILDYSQNNNIDLVVMSTHGRSGISRFTMGSVADRVVRHSKVPVLIVAPAGCR